MKTRYENGRIIFGEGDERWSFTDPTSERMDEARHAARYPAPNVAPQYAVAEQADDLAYLLADCPTTKLAVAKLRQIRRAIREKP